MVIAVKKPVRPAAVFTVMTSADEKTVIINTVIEPGNDIGGCKCCCEKTVVNQRFLAEAETAAMRKSGSKNNGNKCQTRRAMTGATASELVRVSEQKVQDCWCRQKYKAQ